MRILGLLKKTKGAVLVIMLLLVIQAFGELSLPTYTSDIVDVGIQQGGITSAVPTQIRSATLENLELFMSDSDISTIKSNYSAGSDGIYRLNTVDTDTADKLDGIFGKPMVILMAIEKDKTIDLNQVKTAISAGMLTKEQLIQKIDENTPASMSNMSSKFLDQEAVIFVKSEYKAMGLDTDKIQKNYLYSTGAKMIGLTLISVAAAVVVSFLASRSAAFISMDLRGRLFQKVISFSNAEIDQFSTASLITRSTNDIQQVQMVLVMLLRMVLYAPIMGIGGIIKVYSTHTGLGWIIAVAVGIICVIVLILILITMPKFKIMQSLVDRVNLVSREILTGIPVIRAFSREKHEEKRFDAANVDLMKTQLFTSRVMTFMMPIMMILMNVITLAIVWFSAKGIDLGNMQVGDMMAFITYTMQIIMSFMMITMISIFLPRANVAAGRIAEVLATSPTIKDKPETKDDSIGDTSVGVEFSSVSFRFPGAGNDVLENISFKANPGETTAIIGSTGSGKSTVINLIERFYDVTGGSISVGGIDIRDLSQQKLRSLIGYVPQKGVLFSGDIASNIKFSGDNISDEEMEAAAQTAQASEFINSKAEKYESPIAEGGTNVSGGQKQRISIARAIAKNPRIYLFDDSFSALDYKTDVELRRALTEKVGDATVIIIAQRISTVLHANRIVVLDEGKIVGIGTHDELLANCVAYQEIARSQLSEKELGIGGDAQ